MNQARTTYREDYSPYGWVENNLNINDDAFCSPDNIDDCLKYISQEFCALGYPSIYSTNNSCPYAINCDIVKYLNATFEVLKNCHEHVQVREDLEDRNQRLYSDFNQINKKNANLKRSLDELERKYSNSLEKERELRVKNEELLQLLKSERDEVRKLSAQVQRQKIAYQHEARKQEATLNQMKSKISQLLSDKNPNKKVACISPSFALPRNSSQRAKWQTGTVAKSSLEEMYCSIISSYESRWKDTVDEHHNFMEYIQSQMIEILSVLQNDRKGSKSDAVSNPINVINTQGKNVQHIKEYVKYLISKVKDCALQNVKNIDSKPADELIALKSKLCEYEKIMEKYKESEQICGAQDKSAEKQPDTEQIDLLKEKRALAEMSASIEKKKADIEAQKLDLIRFSMQQKGSKSQWHQGVKTIPSVCVVTTRSGMTAVPNGNQLKLCLSAPDQLEKILEPLWKSDESKVETNNHSKSENNLFPINISDKKENSTFEEPTNLKNADLPSWAIANVEVKHIEINESHGDICDKQIAGEKTECVTINASTNVLMDEPSLEELNLSRLKAAMEDIEQRRNILSPTS